MVLIYLKMQWSIFVNNKNTDKNYRKVFKLKPLKSCKFQFNLAEPGIKLR